MLTGQHLQWLSKPAEKQPDIQIFIPSAIVLFQ